MFHNRRSIRLPEYDYSKEGAYFVTICAKGRQCIFGEIKDGMMCLSKYGMIIENWWNGLSERYTGVVLDRYVVMPNHLHGIIIITDGAIRRGEVPSPLRGAKKHTLGQILAYYKYQTTKSINEYDNLPGRKIWQRNYYEHIIRNEKSYDKISQYITENPLYWARDEENPGRQKTIKK